MLLFVLGQARLKLQRRFGLNNQQLFIGTRVEDTSFGFGNVVQVGVGEKPFKVVFDSAVSQSYSSKSAAKLSVAHVQSLLPGTRLIHQSQGPGTVHITCNDD